jgi:outer membrane protein TolC
MRPAALDIHSRLTYRSSSMKPTLLLALGLGLAAAATPSSADDTAPTQPLTHRSALSQAAEKNLDIIAEALSRDAAYETTAAARRPFVPELVLGASYDDTYPPAPDDTATNADDKPERPRSVTSTGGVAWQSPVGTGVALTAQSTRELTGAGDLQDAPSLAITVSQSLMRDGWRNGSAAVLRGADLDARIAEAVFSDALAERLVEVDAAYWSLALSQSELDVKRRSLALAESQMSDTAENISRGLLPKSEIYVVEENVVSFKQQLLVAELALTTARSHLAALLQAEPHARFEAADPLDGALPALPSLDAATEQALSANPGLEAQRLAVSRADIRLAYDKNQALPTLDLTASLSLNGLAGTVGGAWSEVAGADKPAFAAGLVFRMPIWLGPDLARVRASDDERRRLLVQLKAAESALVFAVRDALAELETLQEKLVLAQRQRELAEKKLEAQVEKYKNGVSQLPEVVRFQRDVDAAFASVGAVERDLKISHARFRRLLGGIASDAGVVVRRGGS